MKDSYKASTKIFTQEKFSEADLQKVSDLNYIIKKLEDNNESKSATWLNQHFYGKNLSEITERESVILKIIRNLLENEEVKK